MRLATKNKKNLVSLVQNATAYSVCGELKKNVGSAWKFGKDCTSLSQATAVTPDLLSAHICCMDSRGLRQNNVKLHNNKL